MTSGVSLSQLGPNLVSKWTLLREWKTTSNASVFVSALKTSVEYKLEGKGSEFVHSPHDFVTRGQGLASTEPLLTSRLSQHPKTTYLTAFSAKPLQRQAYAQKGALASKSARSRQW